MKRFDVIGVGYCALDYLGIVERYPGLDEKTMLREFTIQGGGITATAMVAVARLGGRASYIGKVGDDGFGIQIIQGLEREGVNVEGVITEAGALSQFSFVVVDRASGKRTIFATPGNVRLMPQDIRRDQILAGKVLQVDAHHFQAAVQAASWANQAGIPVVMDAGSLREGSDELVKRVDCLITSALFAEQWMGSKEDDMTASRRFIEASVGERLVTAVTLGPRGCIFTTGGKIFHQPAFPVDVVDTTGAGDVFHGAFSFGLAKGWPHREIVEFASAVAGLKCRKLGGRAGIPNFHEAVAFLREHSPNAFWTNV